MTPSNRSPEAAPGFAWPVRVYYEDTDAGGIVFYANYLKFFERARTEWLRACGVDQRRLDDAGVIFVVRGTALDYLAPARLDELLTVVTRIERLGHASVEFEQQAWRGDTLLVTGRIRIGCVDRAAVRPAAIPPPRPRRAAVRAGRRSATNRVNGARLSTV